MKVVIAGGSGYIGQALIAELLDRHADIEITALSRSAHTSHDARLVWKACDLFSLKSLEAAVPENIDVAYYLVHSMGPTAKLDQGSFADYDLLLADNFVRRLKNTDVRRLIYLGGLIPDRQHLSLHLKSRLEVEDTFFQSKIPSTVFRAGLVIGEHGSSFQILTKLVHRLPVMICPRWTQTLTTPVALDTAVSALAEAAQIREPARQIFDLAGCEPLTYVDMMRETALAMGKRRLFFTVPLFTPTLSRLWVRLITGSPKELVYPLVESLEHPMIARRDHRFGVEKPDETYRTLLKDVDLKIAEHERRPTSAPFRARRKTVRSVQRLPLPEGHDAAWVAEEYMRWLPEFLSPFIKVYVSGGHVRFCLLSKTWVLLDLVRNPARSTPNRQLLYIEGGLMSGESHAGRLEFREVLNRKYVLAAIHDFKPSLPWIFYRATQALAHLWVMRNFARHLSRMPNVVGKTQIRKQMPKSEGDLQRT